jgi:toxin ParE1/3/4
MITLHRLAKVEFRKAAKWYRRRSPAAAQRFVLAVDASLNRISGNFHLAPRTEKNCRWIRVKRFPYILVVHEDAPGEYFVVAIAHTSRRPGYWQKRV